MLNNKVYDILKQVSQVYLPAMGVAYASLADLWSLPKALEVVGTIAAIDTLLGTILARSTQKYNKSDERFDGSLVVSQEDARTIHQLEIDTPPEQLQNQSEVTFKVQQAPAEELS